MFVPLSFFIENYITCFFAYGKYQKYRNSKTNIIQVFKIRMGRSKSKRSLEFRVTFLKDTQEYISVVPSLQIHKGILCP